MSHVLLGSPGFDGNMQKIVDSACREAEIYAEYDVVRYFSQFIALHNITVNFLSNFADTSM